jgi:hypothetical protein
MSPAGFKAPTKKVSLAMKKAVPQKKSKAAAKKEERAAKDFVASAMHCNLSDANKDLQYVLRMMETKPLSCRFLASMMRQNYFGRLVAVAAQREISNTMDLGPAIGARAKTMNKIKVSEKLLILQRYKLRLDGATPDMINRIFKYVHLFDDGTKMPDDAEFRYLHALGCATEAVFEALNQPLKTKICKNLTDDDFDIFTVLGQDLTCKLTGETTTLNHKMPDGTFYTWQVEDAGSVGSLVAACEDDALRIQAKMLFPKLKAFDEQMFEKIKFSEIKHMLRVDDHFFDPASF